MAKDKVSLTPAQATEKWSRRLKGAITDIQNGIDNVTESPMMKAVAKKEKMIANLTESVNNGTWEKGLLGVSLNDWKDKTKSKVAQRLSSGVDNAQAKRAKFDTWMVSTMNNALSGLKGKPDMTLSDSLERVRYMMEYMQTNRYKK